MEWYLVTLLLLGSVLMLQLIGLPVAFSFLVVNIVSSFILFGGLSGIERIAGSIFESVTIFTFVALPLFLLMGEVMFRTGIAPRMIDALDKWLGRLPGRLGLLALGAGALLSTLTGQSNASVLIMGATVAPDMEKRGYKTPMSLGPILGSGGLAIMIPPSNMAVMLGVVASVSIGKLLIAIIVPGLLMAVLYGTYIIGRCQIQPHLAPAYDVVPTKLTEKLVATLKYILPIVFVIFSVTGVILLGIATPSEAAGTGALSAIILAAAYGKLTWEVVKKSFYATTKTSGTILLIITGIMGFSQILAFSGATRGLTAFASSLTLPPIIIIVVLLIVILFLGMFMPAVPVMMITIPIFMPIVRSLGFDPLWFSVIMLINMEMAQTTPPFGFALFAMKAVASPDTSMVEIYKAGLPFLYCDAIAIALIMGFPAIALWLPDVMR